MKRVQIKCFGNLKDKKSYPIKQEKTIQKAASEVEGHLRFQEAEMGKKNHVKPAKQFEENTEAGWGAIQLGWYAGYKQGSNEKETWEDRLGFVVATYHEDSGMEFILNLIYNEKLAPGEFNHD